MKNFITYSSAAFKSRITYPLADAVGQTSFVKFDTSFDRSIAGLIASTIPASISALSESYHPASLEDLVRFNGGDPEKALSIEFGHDTYAATLRIHEDDSATLGLKSNSDGSQTVLSCPLRIAAGARFESNRSYVIYETERWLDKALCHQSALWDFTSPAPSQILSPWNDFDTTTPEATQNLRRIASLIHAAAGILYPSIDKSMLNVAIYGRRVRTDGTITSPKVSLLTISDGPDEYVEMPATALKRVANTALARLPFQDQMIAQEWDRFCSNGEDYHIEASCLALIEGTEVNLLSAHEQISAHQTLLEGAGFN